MATRLRHRSGGVKSALAIALGAVLVQCADLRVVRKSEDALFKDPEVIPPAVPRNELAVETAAVLMRQSAPARPSVAGSR
jgi:hypothetical protein